MKFVFIGELVLFLLSCIGMFVMNFTPFFGLEALEAAGWFTVFMISAFVILIIMLIECVFFLFRNKK